MLGFDTWVPPEWTTDVVVVRGGGRDARGNPLPATEVPVTGCLVGPALGDSQFEHTDAELNNAVLYRTPTFAFKPTDRIRVPEGALMAGEWSVDGRPGEWPGGVEVRLVRA